jgi:hypothetical protein
MALALNTALHAAEPTDALTGFIREQGLVNHIEQVGAKVEEKASELISNAIGFLGVPYKRGGNNAETGFDCSGFVRAIYEQTVGMVLPRKADQQAAATQSIDRSEMQPGDLVFFNTMRRAFSHVGIYLGEGKFIHSPKPGAEVRVEDMRSKYWERRFNGARRVEFSATDASKPTPATDLMGLVSKKIALPSATE